MRKEVMHWAKQDQNKGNMLPAFSSLTSHWSVFLFFIFTLTITSPFPSLTYNHCHLCWACSSPTECDPATTPDLTSPRQHTDSHLLHIYHFMNQRWGLLPQYIHAVASVNHPDGIQKPTCADLYTMKCACSTTGRNRFWILKYIFKIVARLTSSASHEKLTWVNVYSEQYLIWKLKTECMLAHTDTSKQLNTALPITTTQRSDQFCLIVSLLPFPVLG